MPRSQTVTQAAIVRALRGVQATGFKVSRVEINPLLGTIVILGPQESDQGKALLIASKAEEGRAPPNDFDE